MNPHRFVRWMLLALLLAVAARGARAQSSASAIQERLVGQPLYLRGFWLNDQLEFEADGKVVGKAQAGPFARSGIDVRSVSLAGRNLMLHGRRIALVADAEGRFERRAISSTTTVNPFYHLRKPKLFVADEEVTLLLHPDATGGFDAPLRAIFVNGFEELATVVPPYWSCYAEGYFVPDRTVEQSSRAVARCVKRKSLSVVDRLVGEGATTPPSLDRSPSPQVSHVPGNLQVGGEIRIHMTVTKSGVPVGLQMVRAVGAGVDEQILRTVYDLHFQPATRSGVPVAADFEFSLRFNVED